MRWPEPSWVRRRGRSRWASNDSSYSMLPASAPYSAMRPENAEAPSRAIASRRARSSRHRSRGANGGGWLSTAWVSNGGRSMGRIYPSRVQGLAIQRAADAVAAAVEDVGIDLRGGDILVAQQLLDGANVVALLQQVGGEGMAQGVAGRRLGDPRAAHGRLHRPLQEALVVVVPTHDPAARVGAAPARREHVLPAPLAPGTDVLALQCARQPHLAEARRQVALVDALRLAQLCAQRIAQARGQHRAAVLPTLPLAYGELAPAEVHVLDPQAHALHQPHAGAIQQAGHQPMDAVELVEQRLHLIAGQHHGQALRPLGPADLLHPRQLQAE